ncbi:MAG: hypothetical protein A3E78_12240 [Alphaproteobacteria bacterium RIFCSPHIGHO2_12_FULL_63_12]|nr:MAG: hypothetical protein A3E78_12240 [Alphaproteobacteria bacterium RIFCSPHIGHO2_12_FULL_63_12]
MQWLNELHAKQRRDGAWYAEIRSDLGEIVAIATAADKDGAERRAQIIAEQVSAAFAKGE